MHIYHDFAECVLLTNHEYFHAHSLVAGNHEMQSEPLFVPFKTRFGGMPYSSPAYVDSGALFYSYDVGGVHVIVLCAYSDYSDTSPQTVRLHGYQCIVIRMLACVVSRTP